MNNSNSSISKCQKTYQIYKLPSYKISKNDDNTFNCKSYNEPIENIIKRLEKDKGYHIRINAGDEETILYGDLDHLPSEEIFDNFILLLMKSFTIKKEEISYTLSIKENEYSYHWSIPSICSTPSIIKKKLEHKKYDEFRSFIDLSIYSNKWFRLPNQTNKNKLISHNIIQGKMEDFIVQYVENSEYELEDDQPTEEPSKKNESINSENNYDNNEVVQYLNLMLENKVFEEKVKGYDAWLKLGILLKNTLKEDGYELFNKISVQMPKYDGENETERFYNDLNKKIFSSDKKTITLGTIKDFLRKADEALYKKINNDIKKLMKGSNKNFTFDKKKCENFYTDYFNTLTSYEEKKQYFEIFVCKVLRPQPLYIYSENDNDNYNCLLYSESEIKETFKHLGSSIFRVVDKKTGEIKETKFINEWIDDNSIKLYNRMDFMPYNGTRDLINSNKKEDFFNLFNGYNKYITTEYNKTIKEEILKPFKELVYELCGADQECYNYFINFLAHLIQKPNERIPICFILKSKQGVGKNVLLDVIGSIIGKAHYITSSNPKDFFGDYAEGFYRKLLVNINECEGKDTFDFEGKIKSFITEKTITLNPKFVRQTTISNFARLIIFTNKPNPIPIDVRSKDRRFCVFQSTDKYLDKKYGTTFWEKLIKHFENPKFIACLYDELNNINLDGIKWKESRPITQAYLDMCKLYVPIEAMFFEHYIDNESYNNNHNPLDENGEFIDNYNNEVIIPTSEIYKKYTIFCETFGYKNDKTFQSSMVKFTSRLQELDLQIIKKKTSDNTMFVFTPKKIYKLMEERQWIIKKETANNDVDIDELKNIGGDDFNDYFVEL